MRLKDILSIYQNDSFCKDIKSKLETAADCKLKVTGLTGSAQAIVAAVLSTDQNISFFILPEKDEAHFFQNDLQTLLPDKEILMFPASYKKAYQHEEIDNANILLRAEVLTKCNSTNANCCIVTYPEALGEKVINKISLVNNTFKAVKGEALDLAFMEEFLSSYDFEKTDFVFEAGQYAVRGGIIDVFSYSNDYPYRVELFGNEIESIRSFNPDTQLSVETHDFITIIPNIQTKLLQERRESIIEYLPDNTNYWIKDGELVKGMIENGFEKSKAFYDKLFKDSGGSTLVTDPAVLYIGHQELLSLLKPHKIIQTGKYPLFKESTEYTFKTKIQPSFNKDFKLLSEDLSEKAHQGYTLCIASESLKQVERLTTIFEELDPYLKFNHTPFTLKEGFYDEEHKLLIYTEHQLFERFLRYKTKEKHSKSKSITLKELKNLQSGDYITHVDYGIGRFAGLAKTEKDGYSQELIRLVFKDDDILQISIHSLHKISRYSGKEGGPPQMSKLGTGEWEAKKSRVKKQVLDIAKDLIKLYAKRKGAPGFQYSPDSFLQAELESSFIYEDTPDQAKATADVKADMEKPHPMDRLVCGDVGFGKTEVAVRAAFKAVCDGKQVAVLVPTTILAMQHYKTFHERLSNFPCLIEYVNRFKSTAQIKETMQRVKEGKTNILIGTHRIIGKDVQFKDLGLLIIDEEQKFGVTVKDKLKEFKVNVDTLTLTATPIPRTLQFSLMGARDLSIIATPPANRQPVTTEIHAYDEEVIRDAVIRELKRGGQVFFVHNRIKDIDGIANNLLRLIPDAKIGIAHGQMEGDKLEKVMLQFVEGEFDILVSTNIIESGLDIPNANTIIINHAHMFGLSDLHQMRGRVGRSNKKAYCYLITPPPTTLSGDSRKRLGALEEFSDLGDGFKVAMRDMDIRGAGNLLGAEQSGFITDIGFEMYHKLLDETIMELKETEFAALFEQDLKANELRKLVQDCVIETDLSILIPDYYVNNISERLSLYTQLDNIKDETALSEFLTGMVDRFGPAPHEVTDLIETVRMRWMAEELGFEKLMIKNGGMRCQFVPGNNEAYFKSDVFGKILTFVQSHPKRCRLKEAPNKLLLIVDKISGITAAKSFLRELSGVKEPLNVKA
ncbi:MAG TPA: transcription-repair coupling factor [Cytophagaceae bacterium]|nr:transcription-repair coupling factor [Cytophagaceae bacterium]